MFIHILCKYFIPVCTNAFNVLRFVLVIFINNLCFYLPFRKQLPNIKSEIFSFIFSAKYLYGFRRYNSVRVSANLYIWSKKKIKIDRIFKLGSFNCSNFRKKIPIKCPVPLPETN